MFWNLKNLFRMIKDIQVEQFINNTKENIK